MTRREFFAVAVAGSGGDRLELPVRRVQDRRAQCPPEAWRRFWREVWPEAAREFGRAGIRLQTTDVPGEIRRSPADRPIFVGLERGILNLVLTDHIPMDWDRGRALAGVTTIYDGYHICLVALRYAHPNQVPLVSLNTCVHELLHALTGDILVSRPKWYQGGQREFRTDWYATGLWLGSAGAAIRDATRAYLARLRAAGGESHASL